MMGAFDALKTFKPNQTFGAITVNINPASAAVRPPVGTVWQTQAQIDAFLGAETAFSRAEHFFGFLAEEIAGPLTVNMSGDTHHPDAVQSTSEYAFPWNKSRLVTGGTFTLNGELDPSQWTQVHAGGTVIAHQVGSLDPFMDFAAATFPNDDSLEGSTVVADNGFVGLIIEHTDSRLRIASNLCPAPIDSTTTVTIRRPITKLRNSVDDIVAFSTLGNLNLDMQVGEQDFNRLITVNAVEIECAGNNGVNNVFGTGFTFFNDVLFNGLDALFPGDGLLWSFRSGFADTKEMNMFGTRVSTIAIRNGGGQDGIFDVNGIIQLVGSFSAGGEDAVRVGGLLFVFSSVFKGIGEVGLVPDVLGVRGSLGILANAEFGLQEVAFFGAGTRCKILDTAVGWSGLHALTGSVILTNAVELGLEFGGCSGSCIRLDGRTQLVISDVPAGKGIKDAGGNLDVGIELAGAFASLVLNAETDVSGALGDTRIDGSVVAYGDIPVAPASSTTANLNLVQR